MKPYLTKVAFGRWWYYIDTKRKYRTRYHMVFGWPVLVVSYRKVSNQQARDEIRSEDAAS